MLPLFSGRRVARTQPCLPLASCHSSCWVHDAVISPIHHNVQWGHMPRPLTAYVIERRTPQMLGGCAATSRRHVGVSLLGGWGKGGHRCNPCPACLCGAPLPWHRHACTCTTCRQLALDCVLPMVLVCPLFAPPTRIACAGPDRARRVMQAGAGGCAACNTPVVAMAVVYMAACG